MKGYPRGFQFMAQHHNTAPAELGAKMDYEEHEKTYRLFLSFTKWGSVAVADLMIAMAFGLVAGGGFIAAVILFVLILLAAWYIL
jgi:hypothetical protein